MKFEIDDKTYDVEIIKKNNKNSYIRVKDNNVILVTTSYFTTKSQIKKMLELNKENIKKMDQRHNEIKKREETFFYLGEKYDIIVLSNIDNIKIEGNVIYTPSLKILNKWLEYNIKEIFTIRFENIFSKFEEIDDKPTLKFRSMKSRWGVYNRIKHNVTLNKELIKYDLSKLDYVIVHELSHIIHFDHSKDFWNLVSKYCPNYKELRKALRIGEL